MRHPLGSSYGDRAQHPQQKPDALSSRADAKRPTYSSKPCSSGPAGAYMQLAALRVSQARRETCQSILDARRGNVFER